jgi:hypothetical protein
MRALLLASLCLAVLVLAPLASAEPCVDSFRCAPGGPPLAYAACSQVVAPTLNDVGAAVNSVTCD